MAEGDNGAPLLTWKTDKNLNLTHRHPKLKFDHSVGGTEHAGSASKNQIQTIVAPVSRITPLSPVLNMC